MKHFHLFLVVCILLVQSGCQRQLGQVVSVADITQGEVITIRKLPSQDNIHAIRIRIRGKIDGNALIQLILNKEPYKEAQLRGPIDVKWEGEWYSDEAQIIYTPLSQPTGEIKIVYQFHDIE